MSTLGDIAGWIETRLEAQVTALTDAKAIATPEEFEIVGRDAPAAGILVVAGDAIEEQILLNEGTQLVGVNVGLWVSSRAFKGGENLSATDGLYDLLDDIAAALKAQTPTSATEPLRFVNFALESLDGGLAVMVIQYETAIQI